MVIEDLEPDNYSAHHGQQHCNLDETMSRGDGGDNPCQKKLYLINIAVGNCRLSQKVFQMYLENHLEFRCEPLVFCDP